MTDDEAPALEAGATARRVAAQAIRDEANLVAPWSGSLPRRWLCQDGIMGQLQSDALGPRYRSTEFGEAVKAEMLAIADRMEVAMIAKHQAPEVTQRARDAAADFASDEGDVGTAALRFNIRHGRCDQHPAVQAFARFEADTRSPQPLSLTVDDNLAGKLNQAAGDIISGATIFSDRVHGLLCAAADRLQSLSLPGSSLQKAQTSAGGEQIAENANCSGDIDRSGLAQEVE